MACALPRRYENEIVRARSQIRETVQQFAVYGVDRFLITLVAGIFELETLPSFLSFADEDAYLVNNFLNLAYPLMIFNDVVTANKLRF